MLFEYKMTSGLIAPAGMFFLLAPLGGLVIAWFSELFGSFQKKVFLDKFAWQMSRMATVFSLGLVLAVVSYGFLTFPLTEFKKESHRLLLFGVELLGLAVILQIFYLSLWKKWKNNKLLHILLGASALITYKLFLIAVILIVYFSTLSGLDLPGTFFSAKLWLSLNKLVYPLGLQVIILSVTAGASSAMLYLLLRRKLDDFGRDYYRYVIVLTAKWLIASLLLSFVPCVWVYFLLGEKIFVSGLYLPGGLIVVSFLLILFLNMVLIRSKQPLRLKGVMICCFLLVWLLFAARLLSYLELANISLGKVYFQSFVQNGWF